LTLDCCLIGQPTGSLASEQRAENCWPPLFCGLDSRFGLLGPGFNPPVLGIPEVAALESYLSAGIFEEDQPSAGGTLRDFIGRSRKSPPASRAVSQGFVGFVGYCSHRKNGQQSKVE